MRVLLINDYVQNLGGAEKVVHQLKEQLQKKGHQVELLGHNGKEDIASIFSRWYSIKWYTRTKEKIKKYKPDIVHIHNCTRILSPSVIDAALDSGIKTILTFHDAHYLEQLGKPKSQIRKWLKKMRIQLHKKQIQKSKIIFTAPSRQLAQKMQEVLGLKVEVIPNGIETTKNNTTYQNNIIIVGEVSKEKGIDYALEAIYDIKGVNIQVIGEGPLRKEIAKKYPNITWTGYTDPKKYYQNAQLLIYPSTLQENFPLATIEAMSYGVPVIAANKGGIREQIINGKTGLLFESKNKKQLREKVETLLSNKGNAKKIGLAGKKNVEKKYTWEKITKEYLNIYTQKQKEIKIWVEIGGHSIHDEYAKRIQAQKVNVKKGVPKGADIYIVEGSAIHSAKIKIQNPQSKVITLFPDPRLYNLQEGEVFNAKKCKMQKMSRLRRTLIEKSLGKIDAALCVGKMNTQLFKEYQKEKPVETVYGYIEDKKYNQLVKNKPSLDNHNILFIGDGPDPYCKGLDITTESYNRIKEKYPDAKLDILGRRWTHKLKGKDITYRGFSNVVPYLKKATLLIHPGKGEAFAMNISESMLAGVPVITTTTTGAKEVVNEVTPEYVVEPTVNTVTQKIEEYFQKTHKEKQEVSKKIRKPAKKFTKEKQLKDFVKKTERLLKKIKN